MNLSNIEWTSIDPLHVLAFFIFPALLLLVLNLLQKQDAREPPEARSTVPCIGHFISMQRKGPNYFRLLQQRPGSDIYTLRLFGSKLYLICSPEWVTAVHKAHKTITFNELIVNTMEKVFCLDESAMEVKRQNSNGEEGGRSGLTMEIHDMTAASLARGTDLEDMTTAVLNEEAARLNSLARNSTTDTISLWHWIRTNLTQASATAIYGPANPYTLSPDLISDFWTFDSAFISLALLPFPSLINRAAVRAREQIFNAFTEYISHGGHNEACAWIQKRIHLSQQKYNLSDQMTAQLEVSNNIAILSNTIPTAFWLLCFIFSDASLLTSIRAEVDHCISGNTISDHALKTNCPLFLSTFRETLRYVARLNSARIVIAHTTISNPATGESYLLKKGSMVQIMTDLIHLDTGIYGSDANEFNPRRFMHLSSLDPAAPWKDPNTGKTHPAAFRSLGSGDAICLGRHFAQSEIMGLAAIFVAGFELTMKDGTAFTTPPMSRGMPILGGVLRPEHDVGVRVSRRNGYESVEWSFEV